LIAAATVPTVLLGSTASVKEPIWTLCADALAV
jgi:hypothetical protein